MHSAAFIFLLCLDIYMYMYSVVVEVSESTCVLCSKKDIAQEKIESISCSRQQLHNNNNIIIIIFVCTTHVMHFDSLVSSVIHNQ